MNLAVRQEWGSMELGGEALRAVWHWRKTFWRKGAIWTGPRWVSSSYVKDGEGRIVQELGKFEGKATLSNLCTVPEFGGFLLHLAWGRWGRHRLVAVGSAWGWRQGSGPGPPWCRGGPSCSDICLSASGKDVRTGVGGKGVLEGLLENNWPW